MRASETEEFLPSSLLYLKARDVSGIYFDSNRITFEGAEINNKRKGICYLSVFDIADWYPIDWGKIKKGRVELQNIEPEVMYSLRYGKENSFIYYPFIVKKDGKKQYYIPDSKHTQTLRLERKFTMKFMQEHMKRFSGGIFEASNREDFKGPVLLYRIDSISTPKFYTCTVNENRKFRYVRYYSPDNSLCNLAELAFYNEKGEKLEGEIIGTDGAWNNETSRI